MWVRASVCVCGLLILSSFTFILSILCPWGASGLRLPSKLSQIEFRLAGSYRPHPDRLERERERENNHSTHHLLENLPSNFSLCLSFLPTLPVLPSFSFVCWFPCCLSFFCLHIILLFLPLYITPCVSSLVFVCWDRYTSVFPCSAWLFLFFDDSLPSCSSSSILSPSIPFLHLPYQQYFSSVSVSFPHPGFYLSFAPSSHPPWLAVPSDI